MRAFVARFEPANRRRHGGLLTLVISDYLAAYVRRGESPSRLAALFVPRLLANPEMHATLLMRLAYAGPRWMLTFWRTVLIAKHSIDIMPEIEIGPGLRLPHPFGIALGWSLQIGTNVTILHNVSIGSHSSPRDFRLEAPKEHIPASEFRPCPRIEDDVIIYSGSFLVGPITIGRGAVIGAESWVDHDIEPGDLHRGRLQ